MEQPNNASNSYKILVTVLINISFIMLGMSDSAFGPTLLDMSDIYDSSVKVLSFVIIVRGVGSIFGATLAGILLDKFKDFKSYLLFFYTFLLGLTTMLQPHLKYVWLFFANSILNSFAGGSLDTGGNVLCLFTWEDGDAGPWMHSIHFSFAIGAFLAPVIAVPFLGKSVEEDMTTNLTLNQLESNSTFENLNGSSKITIFYPLIGSIIVICSFCYLILGICDTRANQKAKEDNKSNTDDTEPQPKNSVNYWAFIGLIATFFFTYVGAEVCYGTYLTTFAVKSQLRLSKQAGAEITSIFWGCFAAMRFISIFTAIYMRPIYIMLLSCIFSFVGGLVVCIFGAQYVLALQICSALLGFGMASIYATGLLWMEEHIKITGKIASIAQVSSSIGADVLPILCGQFIETYPMILMYFTFGTLILCFLVFSAAILVGKNIKKEKKILQEIDLASKPEDQDVKCDLLTSD